jgi:hypothetical protein
LARVSGAVNLVLADDPEAAWPRVSPHLAYQWNTYRRYGAQGRDVAEPIPVSSEGLRTGDLPLMPAFDIVTVDEAFARIYPWLSTMPVAHAQFWLSIAGMPDDLVDRHVELLAELARRLRRD